MTLLTDWLARPHETTIGELSPDQGWRTITYAEFAGLVATRSAFIADRVRVGRPVVLVASANIEMLATWFGSVAAGCPPLILPTPGLESRVAYLRSVHEVVELIDAGLVMTDNDRLRSELGTSLGPAASASVLTLTEVASTIGDHDPASPVVRGHDVAFLQRTSGTTGPPRVVEVRHDGLDQNLTSARRRNGISPSDGAVNWLPLHHDLGLVGTVLLGMSSGCHLRLMSATQLIRNPASWLAPLASGEATLTSSATFALDLVLRRLPADLPEAWDFSRWRVLCLGGERIDAAAMARFARRLAPRGFDPVTFSPGYGLAEATLGVSCEQAERHAMAISAKDLDAWCGGGPEPALTPLDDRLLQTAEPEAWVVASGRPLEGVHVEISPIDGVPESAVGEIVARTPAACRHLDADGPAPEEIWTGDAGFLVDGHLFVLGRIGDAVKVHGRLVHAEDAEAALRSATGERDLRSCVVLGASSVGIQQLVLIVESTSPPEWLDAARLVLNQAVSGKVPCRYVLAGRGAVPRTSSGKPRRRQAWSMALSGAMGELRPLDLADADAMVGS